MARYRLVVAAAVIACALSRDVALSETIRTSPFAEARYPASELDLILQDAQEAWQRLVVREPTEAFAVTNRLLVETGLSVDFSYYGEDVIEITGFITNLDGFLSLSYDERRQLVHDVLDFAHYLLRSQIKVFLDGDDLFPSGSLQHSHYKIHLLYNDSQLRDNQGRPLRQVCISQLGTGVALYKSGSFWFSKPYYLEFEIIDGVAVSGDKNEYVIESE